MKKLLKQHIQHEKHSLVNFTKSYYFFHGLLGFDDYDRRPIRLFSSEPPNEGKVYIYIW